MADYIWSPAFILFLVYNLKHTLRFCGIYKHDINMGKERRYV